jgi:hypothetical protein
MKYRGHCCQVVPAEIKIFSHRISQCRKKKKKKEKERKKRKKEEGKKELTYKTVRQ